MALLVSCIFSFGAYAPSKQMGNEIIKYENLLMDMSVQMMDNLNVRQRAHTRTHARAYTHTQTQP